MEQRCLTMNNRSFDPLRRWLLAGYPAACRWEGAGRQTDHAGHVGAADRPSPALCISQPGSEPAGGRCRAAEHARPGRRLQVENREGSGDSADLPAGAAGQTAKTARSGAGCRTGTGGHSGQHRAQLGEWADRLMIAKRTIGAFAVLARSSVMFHGSRLLQSCTLNQIRTRQVATDF